MSQPVAALSHHAPEYDPSKPGLPPVPTPTSSQQMEELASKGFSTQQISAKLNIPLAQVETALGLVTPATTLATPSTATSATTVSASATRLSVHA